MNIRPKLDTKTINSIRNTQNTRYNNQNKNTKANQTKTTNSLAPCYMNTVRYLFLHLKKS